MRKPEQGTKEQFWEEKNTGTVTSLAVSSEVKGTDWGLGVRRRLLATEVEERTCLCHGLGHICAVSFDNWAGQALHLDEKTQLYDRIKHPTWRPLRNAIAVDATRKEKRRIMNKVLVNSGSKAIPQGEGPSKKKKTYQN